MAHQSYPLPEAIAGDRWKIREGSPRCCPKTREMFIDLRVDPQYANVRAHELAHAKFTPANARRPRAIPEMILQSVEDGRVNALAESAGISFEGGAPDNWIRGGLLLSKDNWRALTLMSVAAFSDVDRYATLDLATELGWKGHDVLVARSISSQARSMLGEHCLPRRAGSPLSYKRTLHVAHWLADRLAEHAKTREPEPGESDPGPAGRAPWGTMAIENPRLDRNALKRLSTIAEGSIFRAPWRIVTDGAIFRHKRAPKTGSILLDASGSMSVSADDIARLARTIPAGIVGAYGARREHGILRILARRGQVASSLDAYHFPGANVIDGPALRWLATQPAPRIWISDGCVTGVGDSSSRSCNEDRDRILASAGIRRIDDIDGALEAVHGKRR